MSRGAKIALSIGLPVVIFVVIAIGGSIALGLMKPTPEPAEEAPRGIAVFTAEIVRTDLHLTVTSQGEVRPRREIAISPQISGRISYVSPAFIDGGFVRRGEVLIRIDDADYRLARVRAESQVASAQQALIREQAEAELARQDWEELGTGTASPLALREPQLAQAQASLEAARSQLRDAELALERTVVRAPFEGRIRSKDVDVGQFVSTGSSLGRMFGTDFAEVALPLTDTELGRLGLSFAFEESDEQPGPAVVFSTTVAGERREWYGRVTRTAAAVDPQTRLISAIATVEDPFGEGAADGIPLAPGLFVSAEVSGETIEGLLEAPRAALRGRNQIFVADADELVMRIHEVNVVYTDRDHVYVDAGVEPGDLAILSPLQAPFDGMSITLAEE
ncbi:efflux RND transporter periplasmic adaptor subunit [Ponticaulis sp.]|uniref:efflux RND transporter periplasmic adaptor subunit n=1 Tax=Ponticaulis sp. TaxID=2020902 RepID=UPI000C687657|nr:efflux RND transporter periplasmic adaptor subunit [Ponticaulis sp.]MBN03705.1 efflux transporter periplasmic adaptor subunit [Ponticaulis sp.]